MVSYIWSCKTSKVAWDILENMFASRNEAKVSFLKRELNHTYMQEDDSMANHLIKLQDLREQLFNIDEVITDADMVNLILDYVPESYLGFQSSLNLSLRGDANPLNFQELVGLLLQEEQSIKNLTTHGGEHAMLSKHKQKGKGKQATYQPKVDFGQPS